MSEQDASGSGLIDGISELVRAQVASLVGEYRLQVENWKSSENSQLLQNLIEQELHERSNLEINRCICFGLGRLTPSEPRWPGDTVEHRIVQCRVVMEQLVLLTMVLEALRKVHPIHEVYFQDPLFTPVDTSFLESLGFTVLQDPETLETLTPTTFVFAPYPPNVVVADIFKICKPALYLGANLTTVRGGETDTSLRDGLEENTLSEAARERRLEKFGAVSTYEDSALMTAMPIFDGYYWSRGLYLYWQG